MGLELKVELMKVTFEFKGSIFNMKKSVTLEIDEKSTILSALKLIIVNYDHLNQLLFKDNRIRNDIIILVDKIDVLSMNLLETPLMNDQRITILPLAHGG